MSRGFLLKGLNLYLLQLLPQQLPQDELHEQSPQLQSLQQHDAVLLVLLLMPLTA